jgi:hypothetical protein
MKEERTGCAKHHEWRTGEIAPITASHQSKRLAACSDGVGELDASHLSRGAGINLLSDKRANLGSLLTEYDLTISRSDLFSDVGTTTKTH